MGPGLTLDVETNQQSGAERMADLVAPARVVKIFNTRFLEHGGSRLPGRADYSVRRW
jgi:predicted dinucleotide-binding enzyme